MKFLLSFLTALVVLTATASGLTLYSATDHVDMTSNVNGQLTLWFTSEHLASFAVNTQGSVVTVVSPASGNVAAGAIKSFVVTFSVPLCSEGTFYETINLDVTSSNGATQRVSKIVEVNERRAFACSPVIRSNPQSLAVSENSNAFSGSHISLANSFEPSAVNVVFYSTDGKSNVANGESLTIPVSIVNRGGVGQFIVSVIADPALGVAFSDYSFVLEPSEVKQLTLTANPQGLQGRQWVSVQVTRSGQVVAVKDIYLDIGTTHVIDLDVSQVIRINNCGLSTIAGTARNTGSVTEIVVAAMPQLNAVSNPVTIQPRGSVPFVLNVDASKLSAGTRLLDIVLISNSASAKQTVQLQVEQCKDNLLNYSIVVSNTGSETLKGVTVAVTDIPVEWQILTQYPVDVAPGETKTLTTLLRPKGQWDNDVVPTLTVKDADGNVIKSEKLAPIKANSATGLFLAGTLGLSGLQWIAAILFVALIIAVGTVKMSLKRSG